jgi:hypothetical protein
MSFSLCNRSLKTWKPIGATTPKVRAHLWECGFIPSHILHSQEHEMQLPRFTFGPHLYKPLLWLQAQGSGYNIYVTFLPFEFETFKQHTFIISCYLLLFCALGFLSFLWLI